MILPLLMLLLGGPDVTVQGRVVRVQGRDTVAVPGAMILLHRVGRGGQGPVDSLRSDGDGAFRFRFRADSGQVYLVSARHLGIEYFAPPVASGDGPLTERPVVVVADTSSVTPIRVTARHLAITAPAQDGTRSVVDLVVIANEGTATRVGADTTRPAWWMPLPPLAANLVVGESDFAREAFDRHGDSLLLHAAIPPGERQFYLQYQLPPNTRRFEIPNRDAARSGNVLLGEEDATVDGGLVRTDTQTVNGERFTRWVGALAEGATLELRFASSGATPDWALPALVAALGIGLLGVGGAAWRRQRRPGTAVAGGRADAERLLDAIAALDARHAGGPADHPPAAWSAYLAERAELKARLRGTLPG